MEERLRRRRVHSRLFRADSNVLASLPTTSAPTSDLLILNDFRLLFGTLRFTSKSPPILLFNNKNLDFALHWATEAFCKDIVVCVYFILRSHLFLGIKKFESGDVPVVFDKYRLSAHFRLLGVALAISSRKTREKAV